MKCCVPSAHSINFIIYYLYIGSNAAHARASWISVHSNIFHVAGRKILLRYIVHNNGDLGMDARVIISAPICP